jgi:hypothetical protein
VKKGFYTNPALDIYSLPKRFTAAGNTTETQRLAVLASVLPIHKIQRLLLTYSGKDDYSHIGPTLRPYARLETLYVGMLERGRVAYVADGCAKTEQDGRAPKRRKTQLPSAGDISTKIDQLIRDTEEEETEDDEEGEEWLSGRMAVRARRRVVEVDVWMDG